MKQWRRVVISLLIRSSNKASCYTDDRLQTINPVFGNAYKSHTDIMLHFLRCDVIERFQIAELTLKVTHAWQILSKIKNYPHSKIIWRTLHVGLLYRYFHYLQTYEHVRNWIFCLKDHIRVHTPGVVEERSILLIYRLALFCTFAQCLSTSCF